MRKARKWSDPSQCKSWKEKKFRVQCAMLTYELTWDEVFLETRRNFELMENYSNCSSNQYISCLCKRNFTITSLGDFFVGVALWYQPRTTIKKKTPLNLMLHEELVYTNLCLVVMGIPLCRTPVICRCRMISDYRDSCLPRHVLLHYVGKRTTIYLSWSFCWRTKWCLIAVASFKIEERYLCFSWVGLVDGVEWRLYLEMVTLDSYQSQ